MCLNIQFSKGLHFFLPFDQKTGKIEYTLARKASVKDIIESLGVPHTEVGNIQSNHQKKDFNLIPPTRGNLQIDEIQAPFNTLTPSFLRPVPLKALKFVADVNVMKLGRLLILLGFDVVCSSFLNDSQIADMSDKESRIVLTRDTSLLKRKKIVYARRLRSNLPYRQLIETIDFFGLQDRFDFFSRCVGCNRPLEQVRKKSVLHLLEPKTKKYFNSNTPSNIQIIQNIVPAFIRKTSSQSTKDT